MERSRQCSDLAMIGSRSLCYSVSGESIGSVQQVYDYFAGDHAVTLPREGYEETLVIPKVRTGTRVDAAVLQAVEQGLIWLTSGPASILSVLR